MFSRLENVLRSFKERIIPGIESDHPPLQSIDKDKAPVENFISDVYFGNKRTRLTDGREDYLSLPR